MNGPKRVDDNPAELRTLRQFLAVAESLHFGRAARLLGMTQPPLTQAIQKLEQQLGAQLFERNRRSVALTAAGAALVEPTRQVLRDASRLGELARNVASGKIGTLRLGFVSTVAFGPLPAWLRGFREARPSVTFQLREATSDVQLKAFVDGELDAGFVLHSPGRAPDSAVPLGRLSTGIEPLLLATPDSMTPKAPHPTVMRWLSQPLVIFPRASAPSLYDAILAFYHQRGLTPTIAQEAVQMQTIVNLVSAGLGVAWVPGVVSLLRRPGVAYRTLPRSLARALPRVETSLVWPEEASRVVEQFVDHVRHAARDN